MTIHDIHTMYNGSSSDDGNGDLETYEAWLERQLLSRISRLENLSAPGREADIQALCDKISSASPNWYDNPDGYYDQTCPYCKGIVHIKEEVPLSTINHDQDCPYLLAIDLSTNL